MDSGYQSNDQQNRLQIAIELMPSGPEIPTVAASASQRFAVRLGIFYAAIFALMGVQLPFFPIWLRAVGVDPVWIGIIVAVPALTRFTVLPFVTNCAGRRRSLKPVLIVTALGTAAGFAALGFFRDPALILIVFVLTACVWTPILPLTDAYALQGVAKLGLHYGPLRLWGSTAFMMGTLGCGLLAGRVAETQLIWVMAVLGIGGTVAGLALMPLKTAPASSLANTSARSLLRQPAFLAVIMAAALIQGSHAAYYSFASITWQAGGLAGGVIASLWTLGVLAEIIVFSLSPRFSIAPVLLILVGAVGALVRWSVTAAEPSLLPLALVQLLHGLTYGATLLGTMGLMVRIVPAHMMAGAQGYLAAASGIATSSASVLVGALYLRLGSGIYLIMAAMAAGGALVMFAAGPRLARAVQIHPQSEASGG